MPRNWYALASLPQVIGWQQLVGGVASAQMQGGFQSQQLGELIMLHMLEGQSGPFPGLPHHAGKPFEGLLSVLPPPFAHLGTVNFYIAL